MAKGFFARGKLTGIHFSLPRATVFAWRDLARGTLGRGREVFEGEEPFEIIAHADQGPFE